MSRDCLSIKPALLASIDASLEVYQEGNNCVVALPLRTPDDRAVEVFIEEKLGDYVLVHDAGLQAASLYVQGMHLTESRRKSLEIIAQTYGATLDDGGRFQIACRQADVNDAILKIAQCVSLSMYDSIFQTPNFDEEPIVARVRRTLDSWKQDRFQIKHHVVVKGEKSPKHVFDSVAFATQEKVRTVGVKVLPFGYGPQVQADRYGFMALDIDRVEPFHNWLRLAVVSKADLWPESALKIVRGLSNHVIEVPTGRDVAVETSVRREIDRLAKIA